MSSYPGGTVDLCQPLQVDHALPSGRSTTIPLCSLGLANITNRPVGEDPGVLAYPTQLPIELVRTSDARRDCADPISWVWLSIEILSWSRDQNSSNAHPYRPHVTYLARAYRLALSCEGQNWIR